MKLKKMAPECSPEKFYYIKTTHTSCETMAQTSDYGFELFPHPPYSPDLAPSDFYVFPNLKKHLGGQKFSSLEEIDVTVNENFATTKHFLKMV